MRQKRLIVNIRDKEVLEKYSEMYGFGSFFIEELLKIIFNSLSPSELRKIFFKEGKEGVKIFMKKKIKIKK